MPPPEGGSAVDMLGEADQLLMERMTSPQIAAAIGAGYVTAVVPLGAIEQHGRHLPIATDAIVAEAVALRVAVRLRQALVAPTIRVGSSSYHKGDPAGATAGLGGAVLSSLEAFLAKAAAQGNSTLG